MKVFRAREQAQLRSHLWVVHLLPPKWELARLALLKSFLALAFESRIDPRCRLGVVVHEKGFPQVVVPEFLPSRG